jgi:hypothetical protein
VDLGVESLKPPLPWTPPETPQTQGRLLNGWGKRLRKVIGRILHVPAHNRQTVDAA